MNFISFLFYPTLRKYKLKLFRYFSILILALIFFNCTATKRIFNNNFDVESSSIRVLLNEANGVLEIRVNDKVMLSDNSRMLAEIKTGNKILFSLSKGLVIAKIQNQQFESSSFELSSQDEIIKINEKKYRGVINIFEKNSGIKIVNRLSLEDYVKGVMTKEMPVGNGNENYEALKAFSICVRTYALNKLNEKKDLYDIYPDTKDQVYGGVDGETDYTNKIVNETFGEVLTFNDKPATVFYHSTCGGFTEDVDNVFSKTPIPYLVSKEDGNEHYCKISPRYEWTESYSEEIFIDRLFKSKLIDNIDYEINNIEVISRFESGRVNELKIFLLDKDGNEKEVSLFGNSMRSIIRTSDNKSILKSNNIEISLDENKNVIIEGKGSGHGVGMCQWGAIGQSKKGFNYFEILNHYYPGTSVQKVYD